LSFENASGADGVTGLANRKICLAVGVITLGLLGLPACGRRLDLGSDLIWSATHEVGNLSEWSAGASATASDGASGGASGGGLSDAPDTSVDISTDFAHSGQYSVKLTNGAIGNVHVARLWRQDDFPQQAFYSVWYYLPRAYQTKVEWVILQFRTPTGSTTEPSQFLDVSLRSLPGGEMILTLYDHRAPYLREPTPDPAVLVPVGRWFQIQVLFNNVPNENGRFTLWLDGKLNYSITKRPMAPIPNLYWTPCSITSDLAPTQSAIYVDDAAVSYDWLDPDASLGARP
jgi:Polysaccharide lyase